MNPKERILVVSHGHPDFALGGGELAAYNLFHAYRADPAVEDAWFFARTDRGRQATGAIKLRRDNEYLWEQSTPDHMSMKAQHRFSIPTGLTDFIRALNPTIVHAHHYVHLGLEYLRVVKQICPQARLYVTLHEFMAMCLNNGLMIKTGDFKLCNRSTFDDCQRCFPKHTVEDFWMRKHYFQNHFDLVDGFIAPSNFLRERYVEWGISPERIVVIENGQSTAAPLPPRTLLPGETRNRFAFFGQINPYKGVDVLLQALRSLPDEERRKLVVEVHGANFEWQPQAFRDKVAALREPLEREGVLQWIGPYPPNELRDRMAAVDWVLVPSIWWENSPMVIQEAFVCGRPVIASSIGGMAEKVRHGVDGLSVPPGNTLRWGRTLLEASGWTDEWDRLRAGITRPISYDNCASRHLELFGAAAAATA